METFSIKEKKRTDNSLLQPLIYFKHSGESVCPDNESDCSKGAKRRMK